MEKLTFIKTISVKEFKATESAESIDIYRSPISQKLAFSTDNGIKGAVSESAIEEGVDIAVSIVHKPGDKENPFYLIHKRQSNNVLMTL